MVTCEFLQNFHFTQQPTYDEPTRATGLGAPLGKKRIYD